MYTHKYIFLITYINMCTYEFLDNSLHIFLEFLASSASTRLTFFPHDVEKYLCYVHQEL